MNWEEALIAAQIYSEKHQSTCYIGAELSRSNDEVEPQIVGYRIGDWYDDATVAQFHMGKRRDY